MKGQCVRYFTCRKEMRSTRSAADAMPAVAAVSQCRNPQGDGGVEAPWNASPRFRRIALARPWTVIVTVGVAVVVFQRQTPRSLLTCGMIWTVIITNAGCYSAAGAIEWLCVGSSKTAHLASCGAVKEALKELGGPAHNRGLCRIGMLQIL